MAEAISPQLLKILVDVTGEVTLDGALTPKPCKPPSR